MAENNANTFEMKINISNINDLTNKVERLVSLLKEAKSLINDLASSDVDITLQK